MDSKPKVALCLYGMVGQSATWKDGIKEDLYKDTPVEDVFQFWEKHFLKQNLDIDIFIHSWSINQKEKLIQTYKPKNFIIEKQKKFFIFFDVAKFFFESSGWKNPFLFLYNLWNSYPKEKQLFWINRIKAARSRWYSTARSIDLMNNYKKLNDFEYDFVVSARLDLVLKTDLNINDLNNAYFYVANFNETPSINNNNKKDSRLNMTFEKKKFSDLIFISNPKYISLLSQIDSKHLILPTSPHRSSYKIITNNIPIEDIKFYLYPWIDFETAKSFFHDWKLGGNKQN